MKYKHINITKAQQIPSKMNSKRTMPRQYTSKLLKDREKLEETKEKGLNMQGSL